MEKCQIDFHKMHSTIHQIKREDMLQFDSIPQRCTDRFNTGLLVSCILVYSSNSFTRPTRFTNQIVRKD